MPYHQLFYHVVWSTKHREPILKDQIETIIHKYLRNKSLTLEATIFALNGYLDHVHLVVTIPPKIAVAKFIGQIKAVASFRLNKEHPEYATFSWQDEYAVFSFDRKRLKDHVDYVERQKEHHQERTIIPILETVPDQPGHIIKEPKEEYIAEDWEEQLSRLSLPMNL